MMRSNGKIDYLEMAASGGKIDLVKSFYAAAFGWSFTDYGPSYAAFNEGLDGGFDADAGATPKPLPILYADDLEAMQTAVEGAGGQIKVPIFSFPSGRRFHFVDSAGNELAVWSDKA